MPHERLKSACIDSAGRHPSIESLILKSLYDENGENGAHIKPAQDQKRDQDKSRQSEYHRNNQAEAKIEVRNREANQCGSNVKINEMVVEELLHRAFLLTRLRLPRSSQPFPEAGRHATARLPRPNYLTP